MRRLSPLITGETYHIYTKSIYGYVIFPSEREYERMIQIMKYDLYRDKGKYFSVFIRSAKVKKYGFESALADLHTPRECGGLVEIYAYCLMPTHLHLIARQMKDDGIRQFMENILNSFSQYFNRLHNRKGPLWQERFGASPIRTEEMLQEKINYVHDNPVKDLGCRCRSDWKYSSFTNDFGLTSSLPGSVEV